MKMRKMLPILLATSMIFGITGCGDSAQSTEPVETTTAAPAPSVEETTAAVVLEPEIQLPELTNLDGAQGPVMDISQACQLPSTGFFEKTLENGRTVKFYISEHAAVRSYFTFIAVPDGVDTAVFLQENGWFDKAEERGECLYILEPEDGVWQDSATEAEYMNAAISFFKSPNADGTKDGFFSTFGEHYFVGYGNGAPVMEAWAVANPIFVISQVYLDSAGLEFSYLMENGSKAYANPSEKSGYRYMTEEEYAALCTEQIKRFEVPVPTWYIGGQENGMSIDYWKLANEVMDQPETNADLLNSEVWQQKADAQAWQTRYVNRMAGEGISQVAVLKESQTYDAELTEKLCDFLYTYTRYDNSSAYGNQLGYRLDYTEASVSMQTASAADLAAGGTGVAASTVTLSTGGDLTVGTAVVNDALREYILYVPEIVRTQKTAAPMLMVWAGGSQTDIIFFDSTQWWQVADQEGIVLIFPCETYINKAVAVNHKDSVLFYPVLLDVLKNYEQENGLSFDFSRVYCTGQSQGSAESNEFALKNPDNFAAVATTSPGSPVAMENLAYERIPVYNLHGQGDSDAGLNFFSPKSEIDAMEFEGKRCYSYIAQYLENWGLDPMYSYDTQEKQDALRMDYSDSKYAEHISDFNRTVTFDFKNEDGISVVRYGQTYYRPHNCYPEEMWMLWDFLEHYSFEQDETGNVTARYYTDDAGQKTELVLE